MTVARQGSPILDPDLRSQPLREAACHGLCPLRDSDATLGTEGRRPDGCHTPLCAEGAGPYGNTAAPPTGIYCHWQYLLSVPRSFADAQDDSGSRSPDPRSRSSIPAAPRLHAHHNPLNLHALKGLSTCQYFVIIFCRRGTAPAAASSTSSRWSKISFQYTSSAACVSSP